MLENQSNNENISLTDFILSLWNGKWILFFSILFFLLITYIFFYLKNSYQGTIEIGTLGSDKHKKYAAYEIAQINYYEQLETNLIKYNALTYNPEIKQKLKFQAFNKRTLETYSDILFLNLDKDDLLEKFIEQFDGWKTQQNNNYSGPDAVVCPEPFEFELEV